MKRRNPIQYFLGLSDRGVSPFELLGVDPASCDEQAVHAALQRRLERLRGHPENISHEADEVRLALHAAAAQLTDPAVRAHLLKQINEQVDASPSLRSAPVSPQASAFSELTSYVLARSGGWNRESRHWLGLLAHAHGLNAAQLQSELEAIAGRRDVQPVANARAKGSASNRAGPKPNASNKPAVAAPSAATTVYEQIHQRPRRQPAMNNATVVWSMIALGALGVVVALVIVVVSGGEGAPDTPPPSSERFVEESFPETPLSLSLPPTVDSTSPAPPSKQAAPALATPEVIVRGLESAHAELADDPGQAAWRFERAVEALSISWTGFSVGARAHANELTNAFLHRADARSPSGRRAMSAVQSGANELQTPGASVSAAQVTSAVWSLATLGVLATDPNADRLMRNAALTTWSSFSAAGAPVGRTFVAAAQEALPIVAAQMAQQMAPPRRGVTPDAWSVWIQSVKTITSARDATDSSNRRADRLTLRAIGSLLRSGAHVSTNASANAALQLLLHEVRWAPDSTGQPPPAWGALLLWLGELAVPTADLAVVTEWVASRSGAPGVGPRMTLSRGSIPESRQALRERYARAWNEAGDADSKGFASVWNRVRRETMDEISGRSLGSEMARIALSARFNAAAALQWRRQTDDASRILMDPASPINAALDPGRQVAGVVRRADPDFDGSWAVRYLGTNERDSATRLRLLSDLARSSRALGPVDADTLAEAALRNPIGEIRSGAQEVVRRRAAEPGIVSALLDAIGKAPHTASTSVLIADITGASLPRATDETWPTAVRLALVDRLLDLLAPTDDLAVADRLSRVVAQAYADRSGSAGQSASADSFGRETTSTSNDQGDASADESVSALWILWREQARKLAPNPHAPVRFGELLRRRQGRLRLAQGPMERFLSDQLSVAEAMAFVISAERPSRADRIANLMRGLTRDRRGAGSSVGQMLVTEQAMNRLWSIRFGSVSGDGAPGSNSGAGASAESPSLTLDVRSLDAAWLATIPIANLRDRLLSLSPDRPTAYFDLAEEIASESSTPRGWALARTLYTLAFSYDRARSAPIGLAPSVCLALAQRSTRRDEKRWLLALAVSLDPTLVEVVRPPDRREASHAVRFDLASGLELYRLGEYRLALKKLGAPQVRALLMEYSGMLTGGANEVYAELSTEPICRECHNKRITPAPDDPRHDFRLCRTCEGDPGPDLSDAMLIEELRLERSLLSDEPRSWSASLVLTQGKALLDVDPAELIRRASR